MPTTKQKIKMVNKPSPEIGIDTDNKFMETVVNGIQIGSIDLTSIDALSNRAQSREQIYELLDSMASDNLVAAVLQTYTDDTLQTNDEGQIVWVESDIPQVYEYTSWLLDTLNIDKKMYRWVYSLISYGDLYVRLYRKSDEDNSRVFNPSEKSRRLTESAEPSLTEKEKLTESAKLRIYSPNDPYIPYTEMVANPSEMFDLQKFGKTMGYIKAPVRVIQQNSDELYTYMTKYSMKQKDVEIYDATSFVHACLDNTNQRQPETVELFLDTTTKTGDYTLNGNDSEYKTDDSMTSTYSVKRGQSILYNSFRVWREMTLLEMSALLNRLTKSSVVRVLNVEVGDMSKSKVQRFLQSLKEKIEQKSAINTDVGMGEYTNPGPIENTIYIPTHNGQGAISTQTIGGDFDPKSLVDLEYFRDAFFGGLQIPKQFFGFTGDGAGFNGGTSLTILSARYGKTIIKLQSIMCQLVTDIINLFLIDRGYDNYVNKFTVKMQRPVTQEEIDKRTNVDNRIRYVGDIMQQLNDIDDKATKLKIYKSLLSDIMTDQEALKYLQEYIDSLDKNDKSNENSDQPSNEFTEDVSSDATKELLVEETTDDDDSYLPSPEELGIESDL